MKYFTSVAALSLLTLSACGDREPAGFQVQSSSQSFSSLAAPTASEQAVVPMPSGAGLVSLDETWNLYTNRGIGFSIKLPKKIAVQYGPIDVIPYEHATQPIAVIGGKEWASFPESSPLPLTLDAFLKIKEPPKGYSLPPHWRMEQVSVKDDTKVGAFLRQRFGAACHLTEKTPTEQPGVFDLVVGGDEKPLDETECPINYAVAYRYQPSKQRLVYWILGMDVQFVRYPYGSEYYDDVMQKSFRFTN